MNELQDLTTRLENNARTSGMEVSSEKSKALSNSFDPKHFQIALIQRWQLNKGNKNKDCSGHVFYVKT